MNYQKKKPIKILLKENEIEKYKKNNGENIIDYNNNNIEEIEKKYDISKLKDNYDEKEIIDKIFHNTDNNKYFKYIPYDNIQKEVNKEYFLEVLKDNKIYDYLYGNKAININNKLVEIAIKII